MKLCKYALPALSALFSFFLATAVFAHGSGPGHIDEGPSPGTAITIIMVISWIILALGIVFVVVRLIRRKDDDR